MVKIAEGEPFVLSPSKSTLDEKNSMTDREWKDIVNQQKQKYYRYRPIEAVLNAMKHKEQNPDDILNQPLSDSRKRPPNKGNKPKDNNNKPEGENPPFNPLHGEDDDEQNTGPDKEI